MEPFERGASASDPAAAVGDHIASAAMRPLPEPVVERARQHLLSYAVQQASGIAYWQRDPDHIEKAFDFGGMGARDGVYAALFAASGWTGVRDPLLGPQSYLSAFAERARPEALTEGLGERHEIMAASIKKWCVGSPIQAALDALQTLMSEHGLLAEQVARLVVHMPDVCLQHLLAVLLIDGELGFAAAHDTERMHDPAVLELRTRIRAEPSRELTLAVPARQAIVEVRTRDGRHLKHHTRAVLGTPDKLMSREEIEAKAIDLVAPVLGADKATALAECVWAIDAATPVTALRPLLQTNE